MRIVWAAWAAALLLAPLCHAATPAAFAEVAAGDPDLGMGLEEGRQVSAGFVDANNNGRMDLADPDEPVYLDADASRSVSYGDVRLSQFLRYPAASAVDFTNRDVGRDLVAFSGWFARDGSTWYYDGDASNTVSVADVRLGAAFAKVQTGDAALGHALVPPQSPRGNLAWLDSNRDGRRGAIEPLFLDTDPYTGGARKVSIGDVRIMPQGLGLDDEATMGDLQAAKNPASASSGPSGAASVAPVAPIAAPWRTLDWILVVVGLANLAGLVVVGRIAMARHPKNPFQ